MSNDKPVHEPSHDGIYPRCVYCNSEIYGPAVIDYSLGLIECAAADSCGKTLPDDYIKLKVEDYYDKA